MRFIVIFVDSGVLAFSDLLNDSLIVLSVLEGSWRALYICCVICSTPILVELTRGKLTEIASTY